MTDTASRIKYADPVDPWEIITTPWGELPAWKADAIANGFDADSARMIGVCRQAGVVNGEHLGMTGQALSEPQRIATGSGRANSQRGQAPQGQPTFERVAV